MRTNLLFTAAAAVVFTAETGYNFRVRVSDDNTVTLKPSTRPRQAKGESGFGKFDLATLTGIANIPTLVGEFSLEAGKYGWYKLVAGEGVTLSALEDPVAPVAEAAAPAAEVPAEGEVAVVADAAAILGAGRQLTVDEAVAEFGVTKDTLKKRISRGTPGLEAVRNEAGHLVGVIVQ